MLRLEGARRFGKGFGFLEGTAQQGARGSHRRHAPLVDRHAKLFCQVSVHREIGVDSQDVARFERGRRALLAPEQLQMTVASLLSELQDLF